MIHHNCVCCYYICLRVTVAQTTLIKKQPISRNDICRLVNQGQFLIINAGMQRICIFSSSPTTSPSYAPNSMSYSYSY